MILCNTACSASSVGALTSTKAGTAPAQVVQHLAAQVDIQVGGQLEALGRREVAAFGLVYVVASLSEQVARDHGLPRAAYRLSLSGEALQPLAVLGQTVL